MTQREWNERLKSHASNVEAAAHLRHYGWTSADGVHFSHTQERQTVAMIFRVGDSWHVQYTSRPEAKESFRRYVLTAEQQAVVVAALQAQYDALREVARNSDEHLAVAEMKRIFAEGGVECDEEGEETNL